MKNSKKVLKLIGVLAIVCAIAFSSMTAFAANITWQVKDYITSNGSYAIVYEQKLDGVATGLVVSGADAEAYGLKGYASSITKPVSWYDTTYPCFQYDEIYADGQYTGLVVPTGAKLPESAFKDFRFAWEVGGTHREIAQTRANFGNGYYADASYPTPYTGANADVKEENVDFGFDVFQIYEDGKARDVEVVLDAEGNNVNFTNPVKAYHMTNAADANTVYAGDITGLVNSGAGVNSVLYAELANFAPVAYRTQYTGEEYEIKVPVYDFTGTGANYFEDKLVKTHSLKLTGPTYTNDGEIADAKGLVIDAFADVVKADDDKLDFWKEENTAKDAASDWDYTVNAERYSYYTNNIVTSHISAKAEAKWVFAGWELAEPYKMYEYLSVEGIVFDGDINNDGEYDTPVIFRYPTNANGTFALANPKVEWKYAWVESAYPHEIYMQKFVEDMNGNMIAVDDFRGTGKYAKENVATENATTQPLTVESGAKHMQMRLEWRSNDGVLYSTPNFEVNEHLAEYIELSPSADPSYIGAY